MIYQITQTSSLNGNDRHNGKWLDDDNGIGINSKIYLITKSLSRKYYGNILQKLAKRNCDNADIICNYIIAEQTEINIKDSTKESRIKVLVWLSNFFDDELSFREMTKKDILCYLDSLRKPITEEASQKWIGSYNARQIIFNKFFRWLYNPQESDQRARQTPIIMKGIKQLSRKEKTLYKNSDLWTNEEYAVFLKYCPSKRDKCYLAMAIDTSARPHELLNLRVRDINFKVSQDGKKYAEVRINGGKTGARTVPLLDSIPYLKDYLQNEHPMSENRESWLFVSAAHRTFGQKLSYDGLRYQFSKFYKKSHFPNLIQDETVPEFDKSHIRFMLTKPWAIYVFRHSSLTEKSQILKESVLRAYAGWTMSSKMPQVYIHYLGNESVDSLLEARGVVIKEKGIKDNKIHSKYCPHCNEPNTVNSQFCVNPKCKMILSYNEYIETVEKKKQKENEIDEMKKEISIIKEGQKELLELLRNPTKLLAILKNDQ
jgi:integrase